MTHEKTKERRWDGVLGWRGMTGEKGGGGGGEEKEANENTKLGRGRQAVERKAIAEQVA